MALSHDKKTEYEVAYKVTGDDLDTTITNTADLSYTCQSHYSSGPFSGSAEARASISAKTLNLQAIVADFGLPVVLDFSGDKHGKYDLARKGTAKYGTVSVKDNVVTYTPNRVLTRVDTVKLYNERGIEYRFNVYPATTVYYKEGFVTERQGFNGGNASTGDINQGMSSTGAQHHYGYDSNYAEEVNGPAIRAR